jgi:hypothetical protein
MPRIHRKKKDSEGGNDGGHDSEEGEREKRSESQTRRQQNPSIFILSARINYVGCSTICTVFHTGSKHP